MEPRAATSDSDVMEEAIIFKNKAPGGSEPLRRFSKSTEKDTQERMLAEMEKIERLIKEIPPQVKYMHVHFPMSISRLLKFQVSVK